MNVLVVTDIHFAFSDEEIAVIKQGDYDVCLVLGDISQNDLLLIKSLVSAPLYGVCGNHDDFGLLDRVGIPNLHTTTVEVNGVVFGGLQGSFRYKKSSDFVMYSQSESLCSARSLPMVDVLLCHDGPCGMYGKDGSRTGLKGIKWFLRKRKPSYCIHGHYHFQQRSKYMHTQVVCCYRVEIVNLF